MLRNLVIAVGSTLLCLALTANVAAAQRDYHHGHDRDEGRDSPNLLHYGFDGLALGATMGLSVGYLATGTDFRGSDWKNLVYGPGVGAIVGVGTGVAMALVDVADGGRGGKLVLRDMRYGSWLGAATGALVGLLVFVESEEPVDVLRGGAIGLLSGGALGLLYGIFDAGQDTAQPRKTRHRPPPVHVIVGAAPTGHGSYSMMSGVAGQF